METQPEHPFAHNVYVGSYGPESSRGTCAWSFRLETRQDRTLTFAAEDSGTEPDTLADRMDLLATIYALEHIAEREPGSVRIVTISRDLANTGTRLNSGLPTRLDKRAHSDLWEEVSRLMAGRQVSFQLQKGQLALLDSKTVNVQRLAREAVERAKGLEPERPKSDYLIHIGVSGTRWAASIMATVGGKVVGRHVLRGTADEAGGSLPYLLAAAEALKAIPEEARSRPYGVYVVADDGLMISGMNVLLRMWKAREKGGRKSTWKHEGKPVQHRELWDVLAELDAGERITWRTAYDDYARAAVAETAALATEEVEALPIVA